MSGVEALLLGLVQGLTEFLPVSSSGHLVMAQELLGIEQEGLVFAIALHVATLGSVLLFYRRRVVELVAGSLRLQPGALRYAGKLALATLPAVAAVLAFGDLLERQFRDPRVAGGCLLATGAILWTTRRTLGSARGREPAWGAALLIGCAQAVAILPGISRSGTTVAAALALGVAPVFAAEFSFLLGAVAIFGATIRAIPDLAGVSPQAAAAIAVAAAGALLSGLAAIWLFVRLLRSRSFFRFAYYTWGAGALFLAWLALRAS